MKFNRISLLRFIGIMVLFFVSAGCATNYTIKGLDIPQMQTGSLLKGVSPKIFAFKGFKDVRWGDSYLVFKKIDYSFFSGLIVSTMALDQPAAAIISMAIKRELERNGHKCIRNSDETKSDFIIEGTVYKFGLIRDNSFLIEKVTGNVAVKLTIVNFSDDKRVLTKNYEGEYHLSGGRIGNEGTEPWQEYEKILHQSLWNMLKELSNDPELIDFIGK